MPASQRPYRSLPAYARNELDRVTYGDEVVGHMFSIYGLVVSLEGRGGLAGEADTVGELAAGLKWRRRWREGHKPGGAGEQEHRARERRSVGGVQGRGSGAGRDGNVAVREGGRRRGCEAQGRGEGGGRRGCGAWVWGEVGGEWQAAGQQVCLVRQPTLNQAPRSPADAPAAIRKDLAFSRPHVRHQLALEDELGAVRDDDFRVQAATGAGEAGSPV